MKSHLIVKCPKCNDSKNVRIFCDIHIPFKQLEDGCFKTVEDNPINLENIKEESIKAECMTCDSVILLTEAQINHFCIAIK